jgi:formate-dependent nitrite reductase cytochrome c552 subunit
MFKKSTLPARRWLPLSCLALLLCLLLPAIVLADSPPCAKCHEDETVAWQDSPHADAAAGAVTCEDCHGAYVKDHPETGIMQLGVDSASCQKCHSETHQQWQASSHGQANVQCISCHLSHSQQFRLTDEALCQSCHHTQLNDFAHNTHAGADLTCTDCHLSTPPPDAADPASAAETAPNHSFEVTSQACIDCHEQEASQAAFRPVNRPNPPDEQRLTVLTGKLDSIEQSNQWLKGLSVAGLGLGLGIGGMLGIVFVMIAGRFSQGRVKP